MKQSRDPYVRIIEAAKRGKGVFLSQADVEIMAMDDAIATRAAWVLNPEPILTPSSDPPRPKS